MKIRLLITFVISTLLSLPFLLHQNIDRDFFAFYYIGRGFLEGHGIYRDFSDNKGPILYLFYSLIYIIFNVRYVIAIFILQVVVDFVIINLLISFFEKFEKYKVSVGLGLTIISLLVIKRFQAPISTSAFYSESLMLLFVSISYYIYTMGKYRIAAVLIVLAAFTRQAAVFYFFPLLYLVCEGRNYKKIIYFLLTCTITVILISIFVYVNDGTLSYFINNAVIYNLNKPEINIYASENKFTNIFSYDFIYQLIILFLIVLLSIANYKNSFKVNIKFLIIFLFFSLFATYFTGYSGVMGHHNLQLIPIFIYLTYLIYKTVKRNYLKHMIIAALVIMNLLHYLIPSIFLPYRYRVIKINEVTEKYLDNYKYLQLMANYQQVYIDNHKESPDRYNQVYFLSKLYNIPYKDIEIHKKNLIEKKRDTLFVGLKFMGIDSYLTDEYINNFKDDFNLEVLEEIKLNEYESIILYYSK